MENVQTIANKKLIQFFCFFSHFFSKKIETTISFIFF